MITREDLFGSYSEGEASAIYERVKAEGNLADFCLRFLYDENYQVTRNALWGLTKANDKESKQLQPLLTELTELALNTNNSSIRRLSLTLLLRLEIHEENLRTDFLDFCFEHMVAIEEFPGIQTNCMKLAFRMCKFYPELQDELKRTIEGMEIEYYKPAVRSLRTKILSGKFI